MLNSILQSIITFADSIWINSNITLSEDLIKTSQAYDIIKCLEDNQIIKRWNYPNLEDHNEYIIPFEKYEEMNNKINEIFLSNKNLFATISLTYQPLRELRKEIETTSKIISIRKDYWSVAIANHLGASRLLIAPQYKNLWIQSSEKLRYPLVENKLISHVLENFCSIHDLTILNPDDILNLHVKNKSFRDKICEISDGICTEFQYTSDVEPLAQNIQEGVWEYLQEINSSKKIGNIKNIGYTISSFFIPALAVLPFADEFNTWLSTKRNYGYVLFLSEMKKLEHKSLKS